MPWVKLDDGFAEHPKIEAAGPLAGWLHVCALCYCNRQLTDGRVPKVKARRLADIPSPQKHINALLDAGMWIEDGPDYVLHDYLDFQPSRDEVLEEREQAKKRMAAARAKKKAEKEAEAEGSADVLQMFGRTSPERSGEVLRPRPDPVPTPSSYSSSLSANGCTRGAAS